MKPGYNTNGLAHHRLEEALDLIRSTGFEAAALTLDVPHLDPLRAGAAEVRAAERALGERGLAVVVETGGRFLLDPFRKHRPNLLEADARERGRRFELLVRSLAIARDLGASCLSLWSGVPPEGVPREQAWSFLREALARLASLGREAGVRIALEPEPGHLVARVADWRRLRLELGEQGPALCLDLGHLVCMEEGLPAEVLEPGEAVHLAQVHLEDARPGRHEHLEPGQGAMDFPLVLGQLEALGYAGPVCWELSRSSHRAPEALRAAWACWPGGAYEGRRPPSTLPGTGGDKEEAWRP